LPTRATPDWERSSIDGEQRKGKGERKQRRSLPEPVAKKRTKPLRPPKEKKKSIEGIGDTFLSASFGDEVGKRKGEKEKGMLADENLPSGEKKKKKRGANRDSIAEFSLADSERGGARRAPSRKKRKKKKKSQKAAVGKSGQVERPSRRHQGTGKKKKKENAPAPTLL